jgi:hypothetical protein
MKSPSLTDLLDPDKWMADGRNLMDFPWPGETTKERAAIKILLADRPALAMHIARWGSRIQDAGSGMPQEGIGVVLTEDQLRRMWEETRANALS